MPVVVPGASSGLAQAGLADWPDDAPTPLLARARPSPLDADEERHPAALDSARRFNPAMALPIPDVWPVEVRYAWGDGADLIARVGDRESVAVPAGQLDRADWSRLPHETPTVVPFATTSMRPATTGPAAPAGPAAGASGSARWPSPTAPTPRRPTAPIRPPSTSTSTGGTDCAGCSPCSTGSITPSTSG